MGCGGPQRALRGTAQLERRPRDGADEWRGGSTGKSWRSTVQIWGSQRRCRQADQHRDPQRREARDARDFQSGPATCAARGARQLQVAGAARGCVRAAPVSLERRPGRLGGPAHPTPARVALSTASGRFSSKNNHRAVFVVLQRSTLTAVFRVALGAVWAADQSGQWHDATVGRVHEVCSAGTGVPPVADTGPQ